MNDRRSLRYWLEAARYRYTFWLCRRYGHMWQRLYGHTICARCWIQPEEQA